MSAHASLFDPDPMDDEESDTDAEVSYEDDHPEESDPMDGNPPPDDDDDEALDEGDDATLADLRPLAAHEQVEPDPTESSAPPVVRYVKLADLRIEYRHWTNPRTQTGLEDAKIGELAASIIARTVHPDSEGAPTIVGITDPLKVVPIANNGAVDLLVTDGQRRYLAATQVYDPPGEELVPVIYQEPDPVEWTAELANRYYIEALHGVGTREGLSAFELSEAAARLRASNDPDSGGKQYTLARIAKELNRSESWVSKILTAREAASPTLLAKWRRSDITEEQFRDLATVKDKAAQTAKADEVSQAQGQGRGAARAVAKEQKLIASKEREAAKPTKSTKAAKADPASRAGSNGVKSQAVRGPQAELPSITPAPVEPRKPKPMPFAVVEDTVGTADQHPPTHDLVKGIILGMKVASGMMDAGDLPKPWQTWLLKVAARKTGAKAKPTKPGKPASKK